VAVASLDLGGSGSSGTASIGINSNAILDTGTNVLLLPPRLLKSLGDAMCGDKSLVQCPALWSNTCVQLSDAEVDAYPALTLQLDGTALHMTARDYLLLGSPLATAAGQYCLGIKSGGDLFIIGDTTMRHYYLVFDLHRKMIGWGNVSHTGCGSVGEGAIDHAVGHHTERTGQAAGRSSVQGSAVDAPFDASASGKCPHGPPAHCASIDWCSDCGNCPTAPCYCAECEPGYTKHSSGCGTVANECIKAAAPAVAAVEAAN